MIRDNTKNWFEYNYDTDNRLIYIGSYSSPDTPDYEPCIDHKMSELFVKAILHANSISHDPVYIHINSIGGYWSHSMAIYDAIKLSQCHTYGIAWGNACSMGSVILQACKTRIITPSCVLMIHDTSDETTQKSWIEYNKKTQNMLYEIYLEKMVVAKHDITIADIKKMCKNETIFTATEAVEYGLADWVMSDLDDPCKYYIGD